MVDLLGWRCVVLVICVSPIRHMLGAYGEILTIWDIFYMFIDHAITIDHALIIEESSILYDKFL